MMRLNKFLQAVNAHIVNVLICKPFAEIQTFRNLANAVFQYINHICRVFSFAKPFAEIVTYQKPANAIYQCFDYVFLSFLFANPFARTQTSANSCKPVCQLVEAQKTVLLCKSSLQKPQLNK